MQCSCNHVIKLKLSSQLIGQFGHVTALQVASNLKSTVPSCLDSKHTTGCRVQSRLMDSVISVQSSILPGSNVPQGAEFNLARV